MANQFFEAFQNPQSQPQPQPQQNILSDFNTFKQNPSQFLANKGINIPQEYANSPEQTAKYLLSNIPQVQQSKIMQTANMLKSILGR